MDSETYDDACRWLGVPSHPSRQEVRAALKKRERELGVVRDLQGGLSMLLAARAADRVSPEGEGVFAREVEQYATSVRQLVRIAIIADLRRLDEGLAPPRLTHWDIHAVGIVDSMAGSRRYIEVAVERFEAVPGFVCPPREPERCPSCEGTGRHRITSEAGVVLALEPCPQCGTEGVVYTGIGEEELSRVRSVRRILRVPRDAYISCSPRCLCLKGGGHVGESLGQAFHGDLVVWPMSVSFEEGLPGAPDLRVFGDRPGGFHAPEDAYLGLFDVTRPENRVIRRLLMEHQQRTPRWFRYGGLMKNSLVEQFLHDFDPEELYRAVAFADLACSRFLGPELLDGELEEPPGDPGELKALFEEALEVVLEQVRRVVREEIGEPWESLVESTCRDFEEEGGEWPWEESEEDLRAMDPPLEDALFGENIMGTMKYDKLLDQEFQWEFREAMAEAARQIIHERG